MAEPHVYNPITSDAPYDDYIAMRGRCPVSHTGPVAAPFYVAIDYADVKAIVTDPATWTARYGTSPVYQKSIGFFSDGKDHNDFRRIFARRLAAPELAKLAPKIEAIAAELLGAMLAKTVDIDFHDDFALPLPVRVIALLLGIAEHDLPRLKQLSNDIVENGFGVDNARFLEIYAECQMMFEAYLQNREAMLQEASISQPLPEHVGTILPNDWISDTICLQYQGRNLTRAEQHVALMGLLVGGNETTTSLMTNLLWRLLEVPGRWERLKVEPDLIPSAIEESLRFDSPTMGMFRTSTCPVNVGGVDIPAKSKIMVAFGGGNHDPAIFEAPDEFRIDRPRKELIKHMAFGFGEHACMGAALSRLEAKIAFKLLVERMPHVRLNGPTTRNIGWNFWGRMTLPIRIGQVPINS